MIIDLAVFLAEERKYWSELEQILKKLDEDPYRKFELDKIDRFHYLYQRTSADLAKIKTFAAEQEISQYLESLVSRAYGEIHETRTKPHRFAPAEWFLQVFPKTFRSHINLFWLSVLTMCAGMVFGAMALMLDPDAKEVLLPFPHLLIDPSDRVDHEESTVYDRLAGVKTSFSSSLMTHNTKVSIFVLALGMTWGVGTFILLFYNGVILGAVVADYMLAGETTFLVGWLLPHGSIEIPAILIAGQTGLMIGKTLIGRDDRIHVKLRFRKILPDLVILLFGVTVMLIWAGLVEGFLSQYHEPFLPYTIKIVFGIIELMALAYLLWQGGQKQEDRFINKLLSRKTLTASDNPIIRQSE